MCLGCAQGGASLPEGADGEDPLETIRRARSFADELLGRYFGVRIQKASFDLSTPDGFDRAVFEFAELIRGAAAPTERRAVKEAVGQLDVDWRGLTPEQRSQLVSQALDRVGRAVRQIPTDIQGEFGKAATAVVRTTREDLRDRQQLAIAANFNAVDRRVIDFLVRSQTNFVTNEYGRRVDAFGQRARDIVGRGLEQGLGRDDIAQQLEAAATSIVSGRSPAYWTTLAGAFIAQGRSFSQVSGYAEAGIERFIIEAVLDEVTTETCRFLHGKSFTVAGALAQFDRLSALERPEDIKEELPWVRERVDADGLGEIFVKRGGERHVLAQITKSGRGTTGVGEYSGGRGAEDLTGLGIGFPPYHGHCRTTTLPDDSSPGPASAPRTRVPLAVPPPAAAPASPPPAPSPADGLAASKRFASTSGAAVPLDGGFIDRFDVQFRAEVIDEAEITKVRFRLTRQHVEEVRAALLRGAQPNASDTYAFRGGGPSPAGRIVKVGPPHERTFRAASARFDDVLVRLVTEPGALERFVEMDIPGGDPRAAFERYADVTRRLGISGADRMPTGDDLQMLRQTTLIGLYDRDAWWKLRELDALAPDRVARIFEQAAGRHPEIVDVLADLKPVEAARGHVTLASALQAERVQKAGLVGLVHDVGPPEIVPTILRDPQGSGLISATERWGRGLTGTGKSTLSRDWRSGGARSVFVHAVAAKQERAGFPPNEARLLIDPAQVGRVDWHMFNANKFGSTNPAVFDERVLVPDLAELLKGGLRPRNEIMLRDGVAVDSLRGIVVPDDGVRKALLDRLRSEGIEKVNGVPIEDLVLAKEPF